MRRSFWLTAVLGIGVLGLPGPLLAENPGPLPPQGPPGGMVAGSVNSVPFRETGEPGPDLLPAQGGRAEKRTGKPGEPLSLPSGSPESGASGSRKEHTLGSLFDLKRQETLLKREIEIRKLKDQLNRSSGKGPKKSLDTGTKGSPMTLLAAGVDGARYAVLSWPDGRRIRVREGEILPDGSRVVRIDGSGVSVRKRESVVTYPYGEAPANGRGGGFPKFSGFTPPPVPSGGRP